MGSFGGGTEERRGFVPSYTEAVWYHYQGIINVVYWRCLRQDVETFTSISVTDYQSTKPILYVKF